ncbi:Hypothetical predicted protein [Paramuricea clavata]|uniref:Deoxyribonuclease NucA/NucB domain-containing protein n=1 Tax=Paramuricea clavata TaxID=317549 RepID=A0A6S7HD10_PARCT|nr:Hypothetical predicted protein [Paramuricea clavata]
MPKVCDNIARAIKGGKPTRLHRITDRKAINKNARVAECTGKKCTQYPFATTREGGKGAFVKSVPTDEIPFQKYILTHFYRNENVGNGGCFNVKLDQSTRRPTSTLVG